MLIFRADVAPGLGGDSGGGGGSDGVVLGNSATSDVDPTSSPMRVEPNDSLVEPLLPLPAMPQAATGVIPSDASCFESRSEGEVAHDSLQRRVQGQERQRGEGGLVVKRREIDEECAWGGVADSGGDGASVGSNENGANGANGQQPRGSRKSSSAMGVSPPCPDGAGGN